jgi:hypothetical protein
MAEAPKTPELDRRLEIFDSREQPNLTLSEFLDWLDEKGIVLAEWIEGDFSDRLFPVQKSKSDLLHDYFGLDAQKIAEEQDALLQHLRDS